MKVAALFVDPKGIYAGVEDVELWPEQRDARLYTGPHPVVAHPPCVAWCRLSGLREAIHGLPRGEDGGCFESALHSVRQWGGVLEHPAYSDAWPAYGLEKPGRGGWQRTLDGAWVCHVEQGQYGHSTHKRTWLYAYGVSELPSLNWGETKNVAAKWGGPREWRPGERRWIRRGERKATPAPFRDVLLRIARSAIR